MKTLLEKKLKELIAHYKDYTTGDILSWSETYMVRWENEEHKLESEIAELEKQDQSGNQGIVNKAMQHASDKCGKEKRFDDLHSSVREQSGNEKKGNYHGIEPEEFYRKEQSDKIKERIKEHISNAEPVVSKWIREDNEQSEPLSAKGLIEENFKGLDELIEDKDILYFYKTLIETCLEEYASQARKSSIDVKVPLSAEEILKPYIVTSDSKRSVVTCYQVVHFDDAIKAMQEHRLQGMPSKDDIEKEFPISSKDTALTLDFITANENCRIGSNWIIKKWKGETK